MSDSRARTAFRFESPEISVRIEGPETFVDGQVEQLRERLRQELEAALRRRGGAQAPPLAALAPSPAPAPDGATADGQPTLREFHERARTREGRGALQDTILVFAYYLGHVRRQPDVGIDEIAACFTQTGVAPPSNLANKLGNMKRVQGFFQPGESRGRYALTPKGLAHARRLTGA